MGPFGDDFLRRAADCRWQASLPTTPEAVYLINFQDADWSRFEPDRSYPLRINADGLRP